MVTAVLLPAPEAGANGVYIKHARVSGDYATASVAACVGQDARVRVAVGGCGPTPLSSDEADAALSADRSDAAIEKAGALLEALADPLDDVRACVAYLLSLTDVPEPAPGPAGE